MSTMNTMDYTLGEYGEKIGTWTQYLTKMDAIFLLL